MAGAYDGRVTLSTKLDTSGIQSGAKGIKSALAASGKAVMALGAATAAAIVTLTKQSVDAHAAYEQLAGGVETLFKQSADKVKSYAENAYKTAGVSANAYMETVTSFSASLISSLGGNTEKAADVANMAMVDMSDNANKMGTPLANIQNAYQGFAKQNYTMLDNLKLGYGGTKTEMERLLKEAEAFSGVKYDINNLSDVYQAIHQIQVKLGVAGTTAKEAESTITGSITMTKSAWENLLTAMSGGGSLDRAIDDFVYSLEKAMQNILPVVERSLVGIGYAIERLAPKLVERIAVALIKAIPSLLNAIYKMVIGLAQGVYQGIKALFTGGTTEVLEEQAAQIEASVENQEALTEAVEETEKAAKKALAGFDELNILSNQNADADADAYDGTTNTIHPSTVEPSGVASEQMDVQSKVESAVVWVGLALLALGSVLAFSGVNIPLGIGFMVTGAAALGTAAATNWNAMEEALSGPIGTVIAIVSAALLVLGAILVFSGAAIGLGIGLMIAGAAGLATTAVVNWDSIVDTLRGPIGKIAAIVSAALLVIGIILLFTGAGIPLGLGLILAGAAGLATVVAFNWDSIVDSIKGVWEKIKAFWNKYIAPIFTSEFWSNLAKDCGNGLIAGFEGAINGLIWLFESLINLVVAGLNLFIGGISTVTGAVGDLIGIDLRIPEIPKAYLGRVSLPRLAKGAVLPANKPFLAVVGDQTHGTNIEAPLSTIQEAVALVMEDYAASNLAGYEAIVAVLREILEAVLGIEIGDEVIGQAVARYNRKMAIVRGSM